LSTAVAVELPSYRIKLTRAHACARSSLLKIQLQLVKINRVKQGDYTKAVITIKGGVPSFWASYLFHVKMTLLNAPGFWSTLGQKLRSLLQNEAKDML